MSPIFFPADHATRAAAHHTHASPTQHALPDAIAFLAERGIAATLLSECAAEAERLDVAAESVLIARGVVSERAFYEALAQHLGLRFVVEPEQEPARPTAITIANFGFAPWNSQTGDCLIAPRGPVLLSLLSMARRNVLPRDRLAITTPHAFARWSRGGAAPRLAAEASQNLWRSDPALSAATRPPMVQLIALTAVFAIAIVAPCMSGPFWTLLALLVSAMLAGTILLRLIAVAASFGNPEALSHPLSDADLPAYSIIVPLYHEGAVVAELVAALDALDYPRSKLDIKLVIEADDRETAMAIERLDLPERYETIVAPPGMPRTKPRALNVALPFARGTLIVVYDAEDRPQRDQLRKAAERFAAAPADVACLQAQLAIDNADDGWLPSLFALEYAALFDAFNPGLANLRLPILLGGTSNHFRGSVLHAIHGWDAWNVTEDADLGLRLARFGYTVESLTSTTYEEAPIGLAQWLGQRRRWLKGWMQTLLTHSRHPRRYFRELGLVRGMAGLCLILNGIVGSLLGPWFTVVFFYQAIWGDLLRPEGAFAIAASTLWCFIGAAGVVSLAWPLTLGAQRRNLGLEALRLWLLPLYLLLISVAAWGALAELPRRPFFWKKTRHGLSKSPRTQAGRPRIALVR